MIILKKLDAFKFGNIVGSNFLGYLNRYINISI